MVKREDIIGRWMTDGNPSYDLFTFRADGKGFYEFINWVFAYYHEFDWSLNDDGTLKIHYTKTVNNPEHSEKGEETESVDYVADNVTWSVDGNSLTLNLPHWAPEPGKEHIPYHMGPDYTRAREVAPDFVPSFKDD